MPNLFTLILQIGVVLAVARTVGTVFRKIHQPRVVGEMIAGIMLGPSLLGWLAPRLSAALFPLASLGNLNSLSQVGLVLFMFLVGLEINPSELRGFGHVREAAGATRRSVGPGREPGTHSMNRKASGIRVGVLVL
jgi:Kef-type K+ transport system membrane component KefB